MQPVITIIRMHFMSRNSFHVKEEDTRRIVPRWRESNVKWVIYMFLFIYFYKVQRCVCMLLFHGSEQHDCLSRDGCEDEWVRCMSDGRGEMVSDYAMPRRRRILQVETLLDVTRNVLTKHEQRTWSVLSSWARGSRNGVSADFLNGRFRECALDHGHCVLSHLLYRNTAVRHCLSVGCTQCTVIKLCAADSVTFSSISDRRTSTVEATTPGTAALATLVTGFTGLRDIYYGVNAIAQ